MTKIALVNKSKLIAHLHQNLNAIAEAGTHYLALVAKVWHRNPWSVHYYADPKHVPTDAILAVMLDYPDQDGVGGWHDETVNGHPIIDIFAGPFLDNGGTLLEGDDSVSSCAMHEFGETFLNPTVNAWRQSADGSLKAQELCDAVQGKSFDLKANDGTPVSCANFVYPAYFDVYGSGQLDQLMLLTSPMSRLPEGYDVTMTPGSITQEFGEKVKPWMVALRSRPTCRMAKMAKRTPGHRFNVKHQGKVWWHGEGAPEAPYKIR